MPAPGCRVTFETVSLKHPAISQIPKNNPKKFLRTFQRSTDTPECILGAQPIPGTEAAKSLRGCVPSPPFFGGAEQLYKIKVLYNLYVKSGLNCGCWRFYGAFYPFFLFLSPAWSNMIYGFLFICVYLRYLVLSNLLSPSSLYADGCRVDFWVDLWYNRCIMKFHAIAARATRRA